MKRTPIHGIGSIGRRKVPRPAVAALRMTSGRNNFENWVTTPLRLLNFCCFYLLRR